MQRNAYSHVSPLCTKRYSKCDILRTLFTINNYTLSYVQRHWKPAILFQLLPFFPSLFAHLFLSILSFSFSSQLVDKSLSCTRIYLNNTSVWQTLVSLLFLKYRLHRVSRSRPYDAEWVSGKSSFPPRSRSGASSLLPVRGRTHLYSTVICTT